MALTSILVHLAHDPDHVGRLRAAEALARRFGARLTGAYTAATCGLTAATGRGASVAGAEARAVAREQAPAVENSFRRACTAAGVEGQFVTCEDEEVIAALARLSLTHDLAIVSQIDPDTLEDLLDDVQPDHLGVSGAAPTLVLPEGFAGTDVGLRPLIGWNGKREVSIAVRGAMPLLAAAGQATVVAVDAEQALRVGAEAACRWLAGHGVEAEAHFPAAQGSTAETLVGFAETHGLDLLVVGGYGRSRLSQLLTGGTSRALLGGCRIPLLMAH